MANEKAKQQEEQVDGTPPYTYPVEGPDGEDGYTDGDGTWHPGHPPSES